MKILISIFVLLFCFSCALKKRGSLNANQYLTWFNMAGSPVRYCDTSANGVVSNLELRPLEYDAAKCITTKCAPMDSIKKYLSEKQNSMEFVLRFKVPSQNMFDFNPRSQIRSYDRMEYYAFGLKDDIKIVTANKDTIKCINLFFERTTPDVPIGIFEFSFPAIDMESINYILINNRAIVDEPIIFDLTEIKESLPKLKV